jgi:hypothetical protein
MANATTALSPWETLERTGRSTIDLSISIALLARWNEHCISLARAISVFEFSVSKMIVEFSPEKYSTNSLDWIVRIDLRILVCCVQ